MGTWENQNGGRFVFTENNVTAYAYTPNEIVWYSGTYTYDDKQIKITLDKELSITAVVESWPNGLIYEYEFHDDLLLLSNPATAIFKKVTSDD